MERELWPRIVASLRTVPPGRRRNAVYNDRQILAVFFWAVLHDRPISWACRGENWPPQAWRRALPDQSTMSRRVREPEIVEHLQRILQSVQDRFRGSTCLIVDGKALSVSEYSTDPDARDGWGTGRYMKGYKLHLLLDDAWRVLAWQVRPLNEAECVVAQHLIRDAAQMDTMPDHAVLVADAGYDSNALHRVAWDHGVQLIAPRRKPNRGISQRVQHPNRLHSIHITEQGSGHQRRSLQRTRDTIERFFGALASVGGGLASLPSWVRRLHRTRVWVGAKLAINAARICLQRALHA